MMIEVFSFGTAAAMFLFLALFLVATRRNIPQKTPLIIATFASSAWAFMVAAQASTGSYLGVTQALELFRSFAWFAFLLPLLNSIYHSTAKVSARYRTAFIGVAAFILGLTLLTLYRISGGLVFEFIAGNDVLAGHMLISIGGLVIIEQLFRNASPRHKTSLKYVCLAIGGMFAYDFFLYSDALLFQRINAGLWDARGFIHAVLAVLLGISLIQEKEWFSGGRLPNIVLSRRIAFHTTALLGAGVYLIFMGLGGYYIKSFGGSWGVAIQATFLFSATLILLILIFSEQLRAKLRVFVNKHFFSYKYDYRSEWLGFIGALTSTEENSSLHEKVIKAMANIMNCSGGMLWLRETRGKNTDIFKCAMTLKTDYILENIEAESSLVQFLEIHRWVIDLDEYSREPALYKNLGKLDIPECLTRKGDAWLIVPLTLNIRLIGFVVLSRIEKQNHHHFNWEDCDILKTAGKQAASHIVQEKVSKELADARRFEEFNRMSAYVVHDIKNLIAQLTLVVTNAEKHKHNPMFMDDAISTVQNSVEKMNRLLTHLRESPDKSMGENINLRDFLGHLIQERRNTGALSVPVFESDESCANLKIVANKDRLGAVVGHIVQNAQDAIEEDGSVIVRLSRNYTNAIIEIIDNGCGMDDAFIKARLFRPFETTKGEGGMGIGVYEVRDYVQSLGGEIDVESTPGEGTTFRLYIPLNKSADILDLNTLRV